MTKPLQHGLLQRGQGSRRKHRLGSLPALCAALAGLSFAATAGANEVTDALVAECHAQLQLGDSGCNCIGETAAQDLNEAQQELVLAMVRQEDARAAELRQQMPVEDTLAAAQFMASAPAACANL